VGDSVVAFQDTYTISICEYVTLNEYCKGLTSTVILPAFDSITVEDVTTVDVVDAEQGDIPLQYETVNVSENVSVSISDLSVIASDDIFMSEDGRPVWFYASGLLRQEIVMFTDEGSCILICPDMDMEFSTPNADIVLDIPDSNVSIQIPEIEVEVT
jgi:hypothetical protein